MSKNTRAKTSEQAPQKPHRVNGTAEQTATGSWVGAAPDEAEIAVLAHRLWLDRGCPEGSPEEDWFLAERELGQRACRQKG